MLPRNAHVGENSTTLGAEYGDPASIVMATDADTRITEFLETLRRPWWSDAACRGSDVDMFSRTQPGIAAALRLCCECPVIVTCRTEAIERGEMHGTWGGLDESALRAAVRLRAKRRRGRTNEGSTDATT